MTTQREIRGGIPAEIRADETGIRVSGYAAVFNEEADIAGMFRETIKPGAFKAAIGRDDVPFLIEHDGLPLARTRSGTLKLIEDDHGLRIETELDADDPDVRRIVGKMKRGDLDKMSFAFRAEEETWDFTEEPPKREVTRAALYDVSIVTSPAYEGTEIGLRSLEQHREEAIRKEQNRQAAAHRVRLKIDLGLRSRSAR